MAGRGWKGKRGKKKKKGREGEGEKGKREGKKVGTPLLDESYAPCLPVLEFNLCMFCFCFFTIV